MRRLMLLRHAKSDWSAAGQHDSERALSARGRGAAALMGRYMAEQGLVPDKAVVSTARRTRETWELLAPAFRRQPAFVYERQLYEGSPESMLEIARSADPTVHTLLMVGHNPGMEEFAEMMVGAGNAAARDRMDEKFPTGALAVIDFPTDDWREVGPGKGRLDRFVPPRSLDAD
jgi:phosphohistidine phosphatase